MHRLIFAIVFFRSFYIEVIVGTHIIQ